jgi:nucleolar GTP-binding protein
MNVGNVVLFILDPSGHCGYPTEVQLNLLEEVKGMVKVPVIAVANKSDIVAPEGYPAMSTADGTGVEKVLATLLAHEPKRTEEERIIAIRAPIVHAPDILETDPLTGMPKRTRIRRPRKPRTVATRRPGE